MRKAVLFILFVALMVSMGSEDALSKVKVFIIAGESNAVGYNSSASLLPGPMKNPQNHIMFRFEEGTKDSIQNPSQRIASLNFRPLLYQTDYNYGTFGRFNNGFGPEIHMAHNLFSWVLDDVAVLKFAFNDTTLALEWNPMLPGVLYAELLTFINDSLNQLSQIGLTTELAGFFWVQGESDAANSFYASSYQYNLTQLVQNLRTDLGAPDMPVIISRLNQHIHHSAAGIDVNDLNVVRTAQQTVANSEPKTCLIDTDDFQIDFDLLHYNAEGQLFLGHRCATAYMGIADSIFPINVTYEDTRNLVPFDKVHHTVAGGPGDYYMVFISAGGGILPTPWGIAGLDVPVFLMWSGLLNADGVNYVEFDIPNPGTGYISFFTHALVDFDPPLWAQGGNNPNGAQSIWWGIHSK